MVALSLLAFFNRIYGCINICRVCSLCPRQTYMYILIVAYHILQNLPTCYIFEVKKNHVYIVEIENNFFQKTKYIKKYY